jgi:N-acetylneuraminate synthase
MMTIFYEDFIQTEPWPIVKKPFVTAEIGINHNGDMDLVRKLIDLAAEKGCDAVKFQKRTIDIVYSPEVLAAPRESPWGNTQRAQKEGLELNREQYDEIDAYCRQQGLAWYASAWDIPSLHFLRSYNLAYNKVASAMLTHREFVAEVIAEKKMTFIGVGMSDYTDIDEVVAQFRAGGCPFIIMHCVSEYPAPNEILNLRQIVELRRRYDCPVGYSGHEMTMIPGVIAVMMGAVAIERHITLSHALYGSDQAASLEPRGLETLMNYLVQIPVTVGDGQRRVTAAELSNAKKLRYWWREV